MKRKVIQLARKTLVVSLPSKWAKQHGIKKGDELEISQERGRLICMATNTLESSKINLNVSNLNRSVIWYYLNSAYIQGTDEIELYFENAETYNPRTNKKQNTIEALSEIAKELIGMEIIKHGKNHCILKEITKIKPEEYENIQRKIFFILKNTSQEILDALKNNETAALQNIKFSETNVNRFTNYCLRILNKSTNIDNAQITAHTRITHCLEEIGDSYFALAEELTQKKKHDVNTVELTKRLNELFASFYDTYYAASQEKFDKTYKIRATLKKEIAETKITNATAAIRTAADKMMDILGAKILIEMQ